ncbi:hypothetical protein DFP72DRAFT_1049768 [Ephemerocybe angulata]|uniref:Uncharacterized protein n=1 Tax=Ephemerocybe angulata TaxID=980116 RepID=A0A8H6HJW5_9AGAR|nr:hypothetical protein DFP72DRAFT_1049768 [Tulosesus angulatus]
MAGVLSWRILQLAVGAAIAMIWMTSKDLYPYHLERKREEASICQMANIEMGALEIKKPAGCIRNKTMRVKEAKMGRLVQKQRSNITGAGREPYLHKYTLRTLQSMERTAPNSP